MGYEFFEEKIIFPSASVPGINNDQSLSGIVHSAILSNFSCSRKSVEIVP